LTALEGAGVSRRAPEGGFLALVLRSSLRALTFCPTTRLTWPRNRESRRCAGDHFAGPQLEWKS